MYKDKIAILFMAAALITGLCGAFFYPLSSLFIVEALGASPAMLSQYMVIAVVSSVLVSQYIAKRSDAGWSRKTILISSLCCYLVTVVSFVFIREYWLAVGIAATFGSVSGAAFGQLFAMGREYGDKHMEDCTSFVSNMRAGIAIAWVFGPPVCFVLKANFGFDVAFMVAASTILVAITLILLFLPDHTKSQTDMPSGEFSLKGTPSHLIWIYSFVVILTFAANNLYITSMPLYLSQELRVDENWLGVLFGGAALCEIPIMLFAGKLASRYSTTRVLAVGLISGCLFFATMLNVTSFMSLLMAQVFNGIFIGTCASLGMVVMQDMMKDKLGTASTLFSNLLQVSLLVASLSVGLIGELYNYYSTLYASLIAVSLAIVLLTLFTVLNKQWQDTLEVAKATS